MNLATAFGFAHYYAEPTARLYGETPVTVLDGRINVFGRGSSFLRIENSETQALPDFQIGHAHAKTLSQFLAYQEGTPLRCSFDAKTKLITFSYSTAELQLYANAPKPEIDYDEIILKPVFVNNSRVFVSGAAVARALACVGAVVHPDDAHPKVTIEIGSGVKFTVCGYAGTASAAIPYSDGYRVEDWSTATFAYKALAGISRDEELTLWFTASTRDKPSTLLVTGSDFQLALMPFIF